MKKTKKNKQIFSTFLIVKRKLIQFAVISSNTNTIFKQHLRVIKYQTQLSETIKNGGLCVDNNISISLFLLN